MRLILLGVLFCAVTACSKDKVEEAELVQEIAIVFESSGVIHGPDLGMCPCCGGMYFTMNGSQENYRLQNLPQIPNVDWNTVTFPVAVNLNWTLINNCTDIATITVDDMELD